METKVCSQCPEAGPQPISEFHKKRGKPGPVCKKCRRAIVRGHYQASKDVYSLRSRSRKRELSQKVKDLKTNSPCTDCGQKFPSVCMDFDHLDYADKEANIARMVAKAVAWWRIEDEIAKCEIVCANCHRIRTEKRQLALLGVVSEG